MTAFRQLVSKVFFIGDWDDTDLFKRYNTLKYYNSNIFSVVINDA
jgi:hypothetical protein